MKKNIFAVALLAAILAAPSARCQELLESVFDHMNNAFGDSLLDAPPDILWVRQTPETPKPNEPVVVTARIKSNDWMSHFKVDRATLTWTSDGKQFHPVDMTLTDASRFVWSATIPGQPAGASIAYYLSAWDEANGAVAQLPVRKDLSIKSPAGYEKVLTDGVDQDLPAEGDIVTGMYGNDGTNLFYCMEMRGRYRANSPESGIFLQGMGFTPKDLDRQPSKSFPAVEIPFVAYAPVWQMRGIMSVSDMLTRQPNGKKVAFNSNSGALCWRTEIANLTQQPERGLQVYTALAASDMLFRDVRLVDATPHAYLYFQGQNYSVQ